MRLLVLILGTFVPTLGTAEIIARSQEECLAYADVALVSRAMVSEGVPDLFLMPTLLAIYQAPQNTLQEVLEASKRTKKPAREWALELAAYCVQNRGRLSGFLGVGL